MARMIPPEVSDHVKSDAERRLFSIMRDQLPEDWVVLHSLGIATHRRKPWAEIDFVLIGPEGVFAIEVKGGRVLRHEGEWTFTNRYGESTTKREGPFDQVAGATGALANYLFDRIPRLRDGIVGYGVATPDIEFTIGGPDIEPAVVYDARDEAAEFAHYLKRLTTYWRSRLDVQRRVTPTGLDANLVGEVLAALRRDFDLRPSLRARVRRVRDELESLTHEQYAVLDGLVDNERVLVRGGAGTGKTLLAVEESIRRARNGSRVMLTCFSKHLGGFLSKAVAGVEGITVQHLHGFMRRAVGEAGLDHSLPAAAHDDLFSVFYPQLCLEALAETGMMGTFDVLIVDEGQDLLQPGYLDVFDGLLDGGLRRGTWRVFLDPKQNIFDVMATPGARRIAECGPAHYLLRVNCRNTQPIAIATAILSGIDVEELLRTDGPAVDHHWYRDGGHQRRLVSRRIGSLLSSGVLARDIVILGRRRLERSSLADGLVDVPFPLVPMDEIDNESSIGYSTVAAFKGLESDVVLFMDVDELESQEALSDMYVGTSRARVILDLFISEDVRGAYEDLAASYGTRIGQVG